MQVQAQGAFQTGRASHFQVTCADNSQMCKLLIGLLTCQCTNFTGPVQTSSLAMDAAHITLKLVHVVVIILVEHTMPVAT